MEANATQNKPKIQARTMNELLPSIKSILSEDAIQTLTTKKQPRPINVISHTTEKVYKPLRMAEMKTELKALMSHSPKRQPPGTFAGKRDWNPSVKLDKKTISHTSNGQVKKSARKLLNFQETSNNPLTTRIPRVQQLHPITPKFAKPRINTPKSHYVQSQSVVRISGVCNIPNSPVKTKTPIHKMRSVTNKENIPKHLTSSKRILVPPKNILNKITDTPLSNYSLRSSSDDSFLRNEKVIYDFVEKTTIIPDICIVLPDEHTVENIAEITPPTSTPFREYRSVQKCFHISGYLDNSTVYNDDTIMSIDKSTSAKNSVQQKSESSFHISLCEMFEKAKITGSDCEEESLDSLLKIEKMAKLHLKKIIQMKESQVQFLKQLRMLIESKKTDHKIDNDKTHVKKTKSILVKKINPDCEEMKSSLIINRPSVIKSPSYTIPKKNKYSGKIVPNDVQTPNKNNNRAQNMYMKMKEQMGFLNTPVAKKQNNVVPDTPAITSHNLQIQLDKLYN